MRDIGDRHAQLKAIGGFLAPHCVVKISSVLAVDGDKRHIAQIYPVVFICFGGLFTQRARLPQDLVRPLPRNAVGADGHVDLKPGVEMITEHFLHLAFGAQSRRGVVGQYHRYQLPVARTALRFGWNQDVIANARVVGE